MTKRFSRSPTLTEVARSAGVSTATVARVLKSEGYVAEATRQRVSQILRETGYRPNLLASNLRTNRSRTVGLMLSAITSNPFFVNVARGVEEEAIRAGYQTIIFNHNGSVARERSSVNRFLERRVDAILFCVSLAEENVLLARNAGVPVVQIERAVDLRSASVMADNYVGARAAMEHLLGLGHREIAYMGGDPALFAHNVHRDLSVEQERLKAYDDCIREAGIAPRPEFVRLGGYYSISDGGSGLIGKAHMQALLALSPRPTAVFATCDILAAGALQAMHEARLRVPDDISLIGFDDTLALNLAPALSSVAQPMAEMGAEAFRLALGDDPHDVVLPTSLVLRQSTAGVRRA